MKVITLGEKYKEPIVLCLGFFDCMHTGHISLLHKAKQMANGTAQVALFTFSNNHFKTLNRPTKLLYTFDERLDIYNSLCVDVVLCSNFDKQFMSISGEEFLQRISQYNLQGVVCGADHRCGSNLLTAQQIKEFFKGVCPVEIVDIVMQDEQKICSTYIRQLLLEHSIDKANSFLSQPFFYKGNVVHGKRIGHKLGFPTVNLTISEEKIAPLGVYGGIVSVDGETYKAVVNVGGTPTFDVAVFRVEAHLLGFHGDLYGKEIKISLTKYLREIRKFATAEQLSAQLQEDIRSIKNDQVRS